MRLPPFFLGVALLFWGWRSEMILWAAVMALIVEASHFISARWDFSDKEYKRVADLCVLLIVGVAVMLLTAQDRDWKLVSFKFFQWAPVCIFPLMLSQAYGARDRIPLSAYAKMLQRVPSLSGKAINISWLYYALCLVSAGATNQTDIWFYPAVVLLVGAALFAVKPRRSSWMTWGLLVLLAGGMGFGAEQGMAATQRALDGSMIRWIARFFVRPFDMLEAQTRIGRLGRIQLSGRIVWRVTPDPNNPPPNLLREASFNAYYEGLWRALSNDMRTVTLDTNDTAVLLPAKKVQFSAHVAGYTYRGKSLLPLPHGTREIRELSVGNMETNRLGVARVDNAPSLIDFQTFYGPGTTIDGPTNALDLILPADETNVLAQIIDQLHLDGKTNREKIRAIAEFFQSNFTYSMENTIQADEKSHMTALGKFLTEVRSGHCEYYATATVLLLRQAGIPARYAIGYAVEEKSGSQYVLRERHGHAWTLVYRADSGHWEEMDTTPAVWNQLEAKRADVWEKFADFFSKINFEFTRWRNSKASILVYLRWLLIPMILFLAWRIFSQRRRSQHAGNTAQVEHTWPGLDSEFYLIEQTLDQAQLGRMPNELYAEWLQRAAIPGRSQLEEILTLHRRLRFDPQSLPPAQRQQLAQQCQQWLTQFKDSLASNPERSQQQP